MPISPSLSDYAAQKATDAAVGTATWTPGGAFHLKMHLGDPGPLGTANPAVETTLTNDISFSAATSGGVTANTNQALISSVATTETYTHWSAWDGSTGPGTDNCLMYGPFTTSVAITAGQNLEIDAGDLDLAME